MKPVRKSKSDLQGIVSRAAKDAIDYIESDVAPVRLKAQKYFDGAVTLSHEEGRSKVVATKCRDVVRAVKPSLMRIFMATDKPVEFVPDDEETVSIAEEQTQFAQYLFNKNAGFRLLNDVFDDALKKKVGIAKVYTKDAKKSRIFDFRLMQEEYAVFASDDDTEIIEHDEADGIHEGKAQRVETKPEIVMESLPPEEFFVDADARSIDDFYVCGHQTELRVGDLVEMGFKFEDVSELGTEESPGEEEKEYRQRYTSDRDDEDARDPSMRKVLYTEAYMRVDVEGTGIPQLYAFIMAGTSYKLLDHYPVDDVPFAVFEIDPEPHTFFGRSLVDLVMDDQDAATAMLRGVLDNVAQTNSPGMAFDEDRVNVDDMLNGEIGSLKRTQGSPHDKIMPLVVPFAANEILSAIQYYDETIDNKTGVTRASSGLDPDALQNATATAVDATTRAANAQPEVMARHLAEGGMKRLFRILARLMMDAPPANAMMRMNGGFSQASVETWNPDFDITVNVGLGSGDDAAKISALNMAYQQQMAIWGQYGPDNGLVTMTNIRNTLGDILVTAGIHNTNRHFQPMDPEREAQIKAQAEAKQAAAGQQPNPLVEAEKIKAQASIQKAQQDAQVKVMKAQQDAQIEVGKAQAGDQIEMARMRQQDDLARDQMLQDGVLEAAKLLAEHGYQVDLNALYRMQAGN